MQRYRASRHEITASVWDEHVENWLNELIGHFCQEHVLPTKTQLWDSPGYWPRPFTKEFLYILKVYF